VIGFAEKYKKIAMVLFILASVSVFAPPLMAQSLVTITINGNDLALDSTTGQAVIIGDRTYVPFRVICENLGAKVDWIGETRQVIINTKGDLYTYTVPENIKDDIQIVIDGQALLIPSDYGRPYISTFNRVMIPLRAVGEALGCEVNWIEETNTVQIIQEPTITEPPVTDPPVNNDANREDEKLLNDLAALSTNLKLKDGSVINSGQLATMEASSFSTEQLDAFRVYLEQLSKYPRVITLPSGESVNIADLSIMGSPILSADQMQDWLNSEEPRIRAKMAGLGREFIPFPDVTELYVKIGREYGIRGDIAFFQAVKETNYFQFTGQVTPAQNNYCGLWATGNPLTGLESYNGADPQYVKLEAGLHGATFVSTAAGVEAHIQHLYAYATKKPLPDGKVIIDPRFALVNRGIAPTWLQLNARWAVPGTTYGQSIIYDYWCKAF
jgi:hypothetical protein